MFVAGDVVRLKSARRWSLNYHRVGEVRKLTLQSNPKMTVERVTPTGGVVDCVWFAGAEVRRDRFLATTLVAA